MTEKDNPMVNNLARVRARESALIGHPVAKRGGDYEFDGEIRAVIVKRSGAVRFAVEDDRGLLLVMNAKQCGLADVPGEDGLVAHGQENPAEVLRGMAEGLAAQAGLGVDHPSFDAAAAVLNERGEAIPIYRLGEAHDLVSAMDGAALIEEGAGWVKVHGVRDASALFNVLRLAKIAAECGEPDQENPEAPAEWFEGARWRTDGVADLTAFRVTTGDPRFDPGKPVTINGFLYHPAKEN